MARFLSILLLLSIVSLGLSEGVYEATLDGDLINITNRVTLSNGLIAVRKVRVKVPDYVQDYFVYVNGELITINSEPKPGVTIPKPQIYINGKRYVEERLSPNEP